MRPSRASLLVGGALAWAVAMLAIAATGRVDPGERLVLDAATGGTLLATGAWALTRAADRRIGGVLVLVSIAWFAEDFNASEAPAFMLIGKFTAYASLPALALLALAFPAGRLTARVERSILAALALVTLLVLPLHDLVYATPTHCCPALGFTLGVSGEDGIEKAWAIFGYATAGALALAIGALLAARWRRASTPTRRFITPFVITGCTLVALNVVDASWRTLAPGAAPTDPLTEAEAIATLLVALSLPVGLLLRLIARSRVIDAVLHIGDADPQAMLTEALRDPAARLALGDGPQAEPRPGRALLRLRSGERTIATLEYDESWAEDPGVVDALARALTLGLENRRLRESRAVLVRTADEERRRLEADLHDGAQQRLIAVGLLLGSLRDDATIDPAVEARIGRAADLLNTAIDELRTLARGARPSPLLLHGVVGALRQLVDDAPLPVEVVGAVPRSLPEREAAAYFVVCEALANAGRHAAATRCRVVIGLDAGALRIAVSDDGRGGARVRPGGGLEGLRHRVEALGGDLDAHDAAAGGSVVSAVLPWPASGEPPRLHLTA
jgi:signal transduction histidine kinase